MRPATDVDDYIANATDAMRPILVKLRRIILSASPKLEESIKWGVPCYEWRGPVIGLAAYKNHVSWGLWKARLVNDPDGLIGEGIMAGGKVTSVTEVPPAKKLLALITQVIALNEAGIKPVTPDPELPDDFAAAMKKSAKATKHYASFTPARKWQYVNWINKARRPETRAKRIEAAVAMIGEGKTMK